MHVINVIIVRQHRSTMNADVACYQVVWSVCRSAMMVSPAKVAELIEMPFGLWIRVGLRNQTVVESPDPQWEGAILSGGRGSPL